MSRHCTICGTAVLVPNTPHGVPHDAEIFCAHHSEAELGATDDAVYDPLPPKPELEARLAALVEAAVERALKKFFSKLR